MGERIQITKPIRLIELFAGIGSQAKALKRLGANFEHYRICEHDKYAIKSYNAIHGTDFETSDITKITANDLGIVDTDKYCYILTYSFPCQDLSLAGKGKGMAKGDNTRSGLLWEVERLLNECEELPQILLMENVTQVHGTKNKEHFEEWIAFLESKGYHNEWKDLNAKNFGIPQNRNRTFMVSVLGDYTYEFPEEFPLALRLKDMLETEVDEKFYLSDAMINYCIGVGQKDGKFPRKERFLQNLNRENTNISNAITTNEGNRPVSNFIVGDCEQLSNYIDDYTDDKKLLETLNGSASPQVIGGIGEKKSNGGTQWYQQDRIYDDKLAISVTTAFNPYYAVQKDEIVDPFICASRGRNPENPSDRRAGIHTEQRLEPNFSGCTNTLTTVQKDNYVAEPIIIQKYGDCGTSQYSVRDYAHTIPANPMSDRGQMVVEPQINVVGNYSPSGHEASRIVDGNGLAPMVKENHGTVTAVADPIVCEQRSDEGLRFFKGDYCGTLRTIDACGDKRVLESDSDMPSQFKIRKLTPKECWRLMGFDDEDFEKAAAENSNTQLYKQAGNSIVVDVLYYLFREML